MPALPGGGAEKVLIDILNEIDCARYNVTLLLIYNEGVYLNKIPHDVRVISIFNKSTLNLQRLIRYSRILGIYHILLNLLLKPKVRKSLINKSFDTIISFMEGASVRVHSMIMDKGSRNVSWVHIDLKKKHWSRDFFKNDSQEKEIYERMDAVAFVSNEAKEKFTELFSYQKDNLYVVYNLIPRDRILTLSQLEYIKKRKLTIILVGRLNSQKRMDRAVEVARMLKNDGIDFEMWILGEGELRQEISGLIDSLCLNDYVKLLGFKVNPYPYMAASDIYLSTSDSEGFSLTLCEALTLGLPCVSTKTTGPIEILDNGKYGILTDFDINDIYKYLKKLCLNTERRDFYRRISSDRCLMFDTKNMIKIIIDVINGEF